MLEYIDVILLTCVRMDGFLGFFNERETGDLDLRRCQRVSFGTYIILRRLQKFLHSLSRSLIISDQNEISISLITFA
jgi:hypothetical protein